MKDVFNVMSFALGALFAVIVYFIYASVVTSPLESDNLRVNDSISDRNKELKKRVEYLDSIKNEKSKEALNLNNDSTIKLWYDLVHDHPFYGGGE